MAEPDPLQVEELMRAVLSSAKYRQIGAQTVRRIAIQELARRRTLKEAIKTTKNKLHQVGGAYLASEMPYAQWLQEMTAAASNPQQLRQTCLRIMTHHASTRERLKILERFYTTLFAQLSPIRSVLDVACGLNPLALPWMPLPPEAEYYACDIYKDMCGFLDVCLDLLGVRGQVMVCDAIVAPPSRKVDLALLLKTLPCLEQVDKSAGARLLETLDADHLLVSFPVHSLGGRAKGMAENYEAHFERLISGKNWHVQRFEFETELAFLLTKTLRWPGSEVAPPPSG